MSVLLYCLGVLTGLIVAYCLRDTCEHEYKLESTTTYFTDRSREFVNFKVKHYQCQKCLKIKDVRVG